MKRKIFKSLMGILLSSFMILNFLPSQSAKASTFSIYQNPTYQFQTTDGEWDVVYCSIHLLQDYDLNSYTSGTCLYGTREVFFTYREVGCGGVNIASIGLPVYKTDSGSIIKNFGDWQNYSVIVGGNEQILSSKRSYEKVLYGYPNNYKLTVEYTIGGNGFYPIPPCIRNGNITLNIG